MADELVIATVRAADQQPGARAPALLLTLDLGTYGEEQAVVQGDDESAFVGRQVVCRREDNGVVVLTAHSHGKGDVLLRADDDVEPGTLIG